MRECIILSNGPQVDPNYKGALFCMLYNGSGQPRLLTLGKHFATIDFTTTTTVTEGYRQKYQLKERMAQFVTDQSVTGRGGAIVGLIEEKVGLVDKKVAAINRSFWSIAAAVIAILVVAPAITVPVLWSEISELRQERTAIEEARKGIEKQLISARNERMKIEQAAGLQQLQLQQQKLLPAPKVGQ